MTTESYPENLCPQCAGKLTVEDVDHCYCPFCQQHFVEQIVCPKCHKPVDCIKGCGAINYLCRQDGLVSKSKVQYHYLLTE